MIFQEAIPMHPDDGKCSLYVQILFSDSSRDTRPVVTHLREAYHAIPILPMSYYIKAEYLYKRNNMDSFMDDFTVFLAESGYRNEEYSLVICPVRDILYLSADGSEIDDEEY